jgi:hypothetical protein
MIDTAPLVDPWEQRTAWGKRAETKSKEQVEGGEEPESEKLVGSRSTARHRRLQ